MAGSDGGVIGRVKAAAIVVRVVVIVAQHAVDDDDDEDDVEGLINYVCIN